MLVRGFSGTVQGIDATLIRVEVNISRGIRYYIVGLADVAVKESLQRIESAIVHSGYKMPRQKLVINLAPADLRKVGSGFELAMAVGILLASRQVQCSFLENYVIMGELSLDGQIQPVRGILSIALKAKADGFKGIIVSRSNGDEAALVEGLEVVSADYLTEVLGFLSGQHERIFPGMKIRAASEKVGLQQNFPEEYARDESDFQLVKGQIQVKRAMEICASGGHNLLMVGPPGVGKTMLAKAFADILPDMDLAEAMETTKIHSVAGTLPVSGSILRRRPFRAPHHTVTQGALLGGGGSPQPGEISLAHNGVLFLDELPEFRRSVLEVLRQPLESRKILISRLHTVIEFPANFLLVAAMNPCPCGYYNHPSRSCVCTQRMIRRYFSKISGPLLDRIDLQVEVLPLSNEQLLSDGGGETSAEVRARVNLAKSRQLDRFKNHEIHYNAEMRGTHLKSFVNLPVEARRILADTAQRLGLSARAFERVQKIARTIADMEQQEHISAEHVAEALQYRFLDRVDWGAWNFD